MLAVNERLLAISETSWQIVNSDDKDSGAKWNSFEHGKLAEQARLIGESVSSGATIVIGLDGRQCIAATIDVPSAQMLRKAQLIQYHLEEWIPWSAEEFVCDFIGHRSHAFTVSVRHQELAPFLRALENEGLKVAAVSPVVLLAVAQLVASKLIPINCRLIWQAGSKVDLIEIRNSQPRNWRHLLSEVQDVVRSLGQRDLAQSSGEPLVAIGLSPSLSSGLAESGFEFSTLADAPQLELANLACRSIVASRAEPLLDLRRGELAGNHRHFALKKEIAWLKAAICVLALNVGLAFWFWGEQQERVAEEVNSQLIEIHTELFPSESIAEPAEALSAIQGEHKVLLGTRTRSAKLPSPEGADKILERVLSAFPKKLRFRVPEIRIEQGRITINCEVRSNTDAELLATELRNYGFVVYQPRIQRLPIQGFSVRLECEPIPKQSSKVEAGTP